MILKSIRFKITILYVVMLALTLSAFSALIYHNLSRSLISSMDTLLKSKAGGIAQAIDAYWEASKFEATAESTKPDILRKRRNINFTKIAQRWVKEESDDPRLLDILVQVFDTDGNAIASSKNTLGLAAISKRNFLTVLQGKSRFDTVGFEDYPNPMTLRVYTTPVFENEKVAYIVQVSSPLSSVNTALNNLKITLFMLFPVTVLLTGLLGGFLAKVTLRPVDNMIKTIHQITEKNLKLRILIPESKDEIRKLAETFNDMLARLEHAFMSQRQLFEDLSHELKTPLTILRGEFEVALKKARSTEEYEAILKSSLEEVSRMTSLAEGLLFMARLDAREAFPEKRDLDIISILKSIVNSVRGLSELKEIRISFKSQFESVLLYGDEAQLKTLFINILDNAIKYSSSGSNVDVTCEKEKGCVEIRIKDSGIGIPPEEIDHIFDRFYRIDKSRNSGGFGLGLSIAKSIVDAHDGYIKVQSKPSQGTVFIIGLPLSRKKD